MAMEQNNVTTIPLMIKFTLIEVPGPGLYKVPAYLVIVNTVNLVINRKISFLRRDTFSLHSCLGFFD